MGQKNEFKFNDADLYLLAVRGLSLYFSKSSSEVEIKNKPIKLETPKYNGKKVIIDDPFAIDGNMYVKCIAIDKSKKENIVLAYRVNTDATITNNPIILDKYTDKLGISYSHYIEVIDQKYVLIQRKEKHNYNQIKIKYILFDQSLNKLCEKDITSEVSTKQYSLERSFIKDKDNIVLLELHFPDGKREAKKLGKPNYTYNIVHYKNNMQNVSEYALDLGDKFITDATVAINDKNQIVCVGLYSNKGFFNFTGYFYLLIDGISGKVIKSITKEFADDIRNSFLNKLQKRKVPKGTYKGNNFDMLQFYLRDLYIDSKGNALLIADEYYETVSCHSGPGNTRFCDNNYHYDDILAMYFDNEGNAIWIKDFDKTSNFSYQPNNTFVIIDADDAFYFIYDYNYDSFKSGKHNGGNKDSSNDSDSKNMTPIIVSIDKSSGKSNKELLIMPDDKFTYSVRNLLIPVSKTEYYIKMEFQRELHYYKLTLNSK